MDTEHVLTIVVAREGDAYVAQCIEYDVRAQAQDMETLFTRMAGLLTLECREGLLRTGRPFGDLGPAPAVTC